MLSSIAEKNSPLKADPNLVKRAVLLPPPQSKSTDKLGRAKGQSSSMNSFNNGRDKGEKKVHFAVATEESSSTFEKSPSTFEKLLSSAAVDMFATDSPSASPAQSENLTSLTSGNVILKSVALFNQGGSLTDEHEHRNIDDSGGGGGVEKCLDEDLCLIDEGDHLDIIEPNDEKGDDKEEGEYLIKQPEENPSELDASMNKYLEFLKTIEAEFPSDDLEGSAGIDAYLSIVQKTFSVSDIEELTRSTLLKHEQMTSIFEG